MSVTPEQRIMDLEQRVAELEAALRSVEYSSSINEAEPEWVWTCHICGRVEGYGHYPDCIVGKAFGESRGKGKPA